MLWRPQGAGILDGRPPGRRPFRDRRRSRELGRPWRSRRLGRPWRIRRLGRPWRICLRGRDKPPPQPLRPEPYYPPQKKKSSGELMGLNSGTGALPGLNGGSEALPGLNGGSGALPGLNGGSGWHSGGAGN